ncbi:serine threonine- kinase PLK4, partial [Brachionus plicatilis]
QHMDKKSKKTAAPAQADQRIQDCVSPLKAGSTLLRPTRQASKNAVLNIMDGNEVVLELIKVKKSQQFIMEVIRIEPDHDLITIYQPNGGKGSPIANRPPPLPPHSQLYVQYSYATLPQNYWKKYDLASKFVRMVRSRTPKITLHTDEAKCILYDTSPDFEALFYQGTKFHIAKEGHVKITNADGTSISLESNSRSTCLSPEIQDMFEKAHKWHKFCLEEELMREKRKEIYRDIIAFPLTIGRRPQVPKMAALMSSSQPNLASKGKMSGEDELGMFNKNMKQMELKSASSTSLTNSSESLRRSDKAATFDSAPPTPPPPPPLSAYPQSYQISEHTEPNQYFYRSQFSMPVVTNGHSGVNQQSISYQQLQQQVKLNRQLSNC